ncbi:hypothetical protein PC116_g21356 [Phytophthora cactorum]|nr:hypothetical protein PC116_g21356 [Phytophthora cactorum]
MSFATLALRKGVAALLLKKDSLTWRVLAGKLGAGPAFANTARVCYGSVDPFFNTFTSSQKTVYGKGGLETSLES